MKKFIFAISILLCYNTVHADSTKVRYVSDDRGGTVQCVTSDGFTQSSTGISCNWEGYNAKVNKKLATKDALLRAMIQLRSIIITFQAYGDMIERHAKRGGTFSADEEIEFDKHFPSVYDEKTLK